jgi:hypothetical protein
MQHISPTPFLRRALAADAAMSGAAALILVAGAGILSSPLGLPEPLLRGAGLVLVPFIAAVTFMSTQRTLPLQALWVIVALNAAWVVATLSILVSGWVTPTVLGYAFAIVQALAVAGFAELQVMGLRRPTAIA